MSASVIRCLEKETPVDAASALEADSREEAEKFLWMALLSITYVVIEDQPTNRSIGTNFS